MPDPALRYCLGCSYLLVGLPMNRCPECGRAFDPHDPATFRIKPLSPFLAGFVTWMGNLSLWWSLALALLVIPGSWMLAPSFVLGAIVWLASFVLTLSVSLWYLALRAARIPAGRKMLLIFAAWALAVSVPITDWPFRVSLLGIRPELNRLADRVERNDIPAWPQQIGRFLIQGAEVREGDIICLWTHPDPGGNTGFVRCPSGGPRGKFNLASTTYAGADWYYIGED